MNKFNFVMDGERKLLPPGFRFEPTDEEIIFQYLAPKIFSFPLPASIIPEFHTIFTSNPWELPGNLEQDNKYFFAKRETHHHHHHHHHQSNNIIKRSSKCVGFWKVSGSHKEIIMGSKRMPVVGIKTTLVFYKGKHPYATRTHWFMHLYCIALSPHNKLHSQGSSIQIGKWVLCHVFMKRRSSMIINGRVCDRFTALAHSIDDTHSSSSSSSDSDSSVFSEVTWSTDNSEIGDNSNI